MIPYEIKANNTVYDFLYSVWLFYKVFNLRVGRQYSLSMKNDDYLHI